MQYSINKQEEYTILTLEVDKLDSLQAPALKSELVTIANSGTTSLILNMSTVKYTDSSGLSALLVGNRIVQEDGGIFVLANLSDHTTKLIKISQLDSVLNILPTVEEAVDAVFMHEVEKELGDEE